MTVAVVDYGAGNLRSVLNILTYLGEEPELARTPEAVRAADRIVLPGVGAAGEALARLRSQGLDEALDETVRGRGRPFLGICLGMQILAERLTEFGAQTGLGWIEGDVVHLRDFADEQRGLRAPHMGWNLVEVDPTARDLFAGVKNGGEFYFSHSYTLRPTRPADVVAFTPYGGAMVSAVRRDTVFAVQFHPEKSQVNGERLMAAFLDWNP